MIELSNNIINWRKEIALNIKFQRSLFLEILNRNIFLMSQSLGQCSITEIFTLILYNHITHINISNLEAPTNVVLQINFSKPLQQLGTDVYGYESMLVYQVNKYEASDGSKPFGKAPDSQLAICSLKMIN